MITIKASDLEAALRPGMGIVREKVLRQVLQCFHIKGGTIEATNLDASYFVAMEQAQIEDMDVCLDATRLYEAAKRFSGNDISISPDGRITCGKSTVRVNSLPAEEFPEIKKGSGGSLLEVLPDEILAVGVACADKGASHLRGVCIAPEYVAATEGARVHMINRKTGIDSKIGIHSASLPIIAGTSEVIVDNKFAYFSGGIPGVVSVRLMESEFVDFCRFRDAAAKKQQCIFSKGDMLAAINVLDISADRKIPKATMMFSDNKIKLASEDGSGAYAKTEIACQTLPGFPSKVSINLDFFVDAIAFAYPEGGDVVLCAKEEGSMVSLANGERFAGVMPMRLPS